MSDSKINNPLDSITEEGVKNALKNNSLLKKLQASTPENCNHVPDAMKEGDSTAHCGKCGEFYRLSSASEEK